ncbi:MAG: hypothetical protein J1E16_06605 [Muribaculaceae bacterium]|nr:hypothetical protein [Muribaculaceae bacterium]
MADYVVKLSGKDNLTPTINNVKNALNGMSSTAKGADKIKERFDKIQNSSMNLSKKLSETKKQMRELASMGGTNTKAFEEMAKAAQSYKKSLDEVDKSIKNVGKNPLEKAMGNVGDITSKMGLGNISSSITSAITNPYILAGTAVVGATKALWDYEVELDRSLQKTAQFTGLSGDELMSLRNGIKSLADTFGTDYDTVLSSVDGMMHQFGITGEEALQILNDGFTSMGEGGAQKVLDLVGKYQGAFNDAGISASELVAIIGNTRSGIFSEEGMDLIAMSAKKLREFNKGTQESLEAVGINAEEMFNKIQTGQITTVQAMQQVSERIKDLSPQSKEVGDVFKNVFGKQASSAGMELVSALADVETNLDVVKQQTGEWGDAMQQLQQSNREFENAMSALFGVADGGFSNMTTKLKAEVFGAVAKVINGFIEWYNKSLVVRGAIANIALQFKNAWEVIKAILKIFIDSVKGLADVIEGVFTLDWEKVKSGWKNGVQNILKTVATGFENIKENVKDAAEQTLHGEIKVIPVPEEVEYSGNNRQISGSGSKLDKGGKKGGSKGNNSSTKVETVADAGSLEAEEKKLQELQNLLKKTDPTNLDRVKELNQQIIDQQKKVNNLKLVYDFRLDVDYTKMSFTDLEKEIKKCDDIIKSNILSEEGKNEIEDRRNVLIEYQAEMLNNTVAGLSKQISDIDKRLQNEVLNPSERQELLTQKRIKVLAKAELEGDFSDKTISGLEAQISRLQERLNNEELTVTERIKIIQSIEEKNDLKDRLENPNIKEGSLAYVQKQISDKKAKLELEVVGSDEYNRIAQEIANLEDEEHIIKVKIENDGIDSNIEKQEKFRQSLSGIGDGVSKVTGAFGNLAGAIGQVTENEGMAKAALIAQAIGELALSFAQSMKGTFTPWDWIAAGVSGAAVLTSLIGQLSSFATGGVVEGSSMIGDHMLARVNSGEMILNGRQQDNLFNAIDNNRLGGGGLSGDVNFKIDGTVIKGVLNNLNKKISKQS